MAQKKGYALVGCNSVGGNAFFVRSDLIKDKFYSSLTSEEHFEPPRYFLSQRSNGHRNKIDFYVNLSK